MLESFLSVLRRNLDPKEVPYDISQTLSGGDKARFARLVPDDVRQTEVVDR